MSKTFKLSPSPGIGNKISTVVYGAGSAYSLTQTPALVNLGTTPPSITLADAGTYLLLARAGLKYNVATFAAVRTVTLKLRRTNNTPADLSNAITTFLTSIITLLTFTAGSLVVPPVIYTAQNGDVVQLFGSIDTLPTAGSIDITECEIVAIKLS